MDKNNPYAYTLKMSRDSMVMFADEFEYLTVTPKKGEWIVQGKGIYGDTKVDSYEKIKTSTYGGIATAEYGITDRSSFGFVLGGNHQNADFKGSSKIDANSLYIGTFGKVKKDSFKFISGLGYQYTHAKGERGIFNSYDSFSGSDSYDVNGLNAFVEGKYRYELNREWSLEPKLRFSYFYVNQDKVDEGYRNKGLDIAVDEESANSFAFEFGNDLIREQHLKSGVLKNIFSVGVVRNFGDLDRDMDAQVIGEYGTGRKFKVDGVEIDKVVGKIGYNLEYEKTDGMIYTAGVKLEFGKNDYRNFKATVGMGYRF